MSDCPEHIYAEQHDLNRARLYTEMLTAGAVIHGDRRRLPASARQNIRSPCSSPGPTRHPWSRRRASARLSASMRSISTSPPLEFQAANVSAKTGRSARAPSSTGHNEKTN
jgi:hypothetical protein